MSVVERVISVQYRHQLHFTDRVFAPENPVLASLLTGGPSEASEAVGKKLPPRVRRQGKTEDPDAPPRKRRTAASQCAEAMQALRERLSRSGR